MVTDRRRTERFSAAVRRLSPTCEGFGRPPGLLGLFGSLVSAETPRLHAVSWARTFTLLALVVLVVAFAATWLTLPVDALDDDASPPASFFLVGLGSRETCLRYGEGIPGNRACLERSRQAGVDLNQNDLEALRARVTVVYASAAAVVVLLGLAFGAGRRRPELPTP